MDRTFRHVNGLKMLVASLLLVLPLLAPAAHAADGSEERDDEPFRTISAAQLQEIMVGEGYSVRSDEDGDLVWALDGYKALILISADSGALLFRTSFRGTDTTLDDVNAWNRAMRLSRSFLDRDGDPVLELDLDLAGGVTKARIVDYLVTCKSSFRKWVSRVVE